MSKSRINLPKVDNNLIEVKSKVSYAMKFTKIFCFLSFHFFFGLVVKILHLARLDLILWFDLIVMWLTWKSRWKNEIVTSYKVVIRFGCTRVIHIPCSCILWTIEAETHRLLVISSGLPSSLHAIGIQLMFRFFRSDIVCFLATPKNQQVVRNSPVRLLALELETVFV